MFQFSHISENLLVVFLNVSKSPPRPSQLCLPSPGAWWEGPVECWKGVWLAAWPSSTCILSTPVISPLESHSSFLGWRGGSGRRNKMNLFKLWESLIPSRFSLASHTKGPRRRKASSNQMWLSVFGSWFHLAGLKDLKRRGRVKTSNFVLEGNFSAQQMESSLQDSWS